MEQYHEYADATMETMLDSLENLVDEAGQPEYEVDYSVSSKRSLHPYHRSRVPCRRAGC